MDGKEKRGSQRKQVAVTTFVRQTLPDGTPKLVQFRSRDLSNSGIFVLTHDLDLYDVGEELEVIVSQGKHDYYMGKAKVVRSTRDLPEDGESGFGLTFVSPDEAFSSAIGSTLEAY